MNCAKSNLKEQIEQFDKGLITDYDGNVDFNCFNFYDWFCNDSSLKNKSIKLFKQVKVFLKNHPEIDLTKHYVFFKNNMPMYGSLYDDFRICDREEGNVLYTVTPRSGYKKDFGKAEVWGKANDFKEPLQVAASFSKLFKQAS